METEGEDIIVQRQGNVGNQIWGMGMDPGIRNVSVGAPSQEMAEVEGSKRGEGGPAGSLEPQGRPKRAAARSKKAIGAAANFEIAAEAGRKRSAEWSLADQVASLKVILEGLVKQHCKREEQMQEEIKNLRQETRELRDAVQGWKQIQLGEERAKSQAQAAFQEEHKKQGAAIQVVQALLGEKDKRPSYSEAARASSTQAEQPWTTVQRKKTTACPQVHRDEKSVILNASRTKAERQDYAVVKARLQEGLENTQATAGLKIECLRPGVGHRIEVVFATKAQAEKAKKHTRWATSQMPGTRLQDEEWFPVKCDLVAKQAVLESTEGDPTLKKELAAQFKEQNSTADVDCTVTKARWLSKVDLQKKAGSLVLWLKNKAAASYLLNKGTAMFGATGAFCSPWEAREVGQLCFNCNRHGHLQAACTAPPRCAICSGKHQRLDCKQQTNPKCPVCNKKGHTALSWECAMHASHWKYIGRMKSTAAKEGARAQGTLTEMNTVAQGNQQTQSALEVDQSDPGVSQRTSTVEIQMDEAPIVIS